MTKSAAAAVAGGSGGAPVAASGGGGVDASTSVVPSPTSNSTSTHTTHHSPTASPDPYHHLLYALRILRVFMLIFVPCAAVVLIILTVQLVDGFTNHFDDPRPPPPATIADAVPLLVLDSIGWCLVGLMLWYSFPVLHDEKGGARATLASLHQPQLHHPPSHGNALPRVVTSPIHIKPASTGTGATNGAAAALLRPPLLGARAVSDLLPGMSVPITDERLSPRAAKTVQATDFVAVTPIVVTVPKPDTTTAPPPLAPLSRYA